MSGDSLNNWLHHIQRQHFRSVDLTLERAAEVWRRLGGGEGRPPGRRLCIAVAGSNGKGSCVAMLDAALRAAGLTVGAYTSPHLTRYNERVCIDGRAADDAELCDAFAEVERARRGKRGGDTIPLTYFEFGTLCALLIFRRRAVDAAVLEVGMGGRLDAVNLVQNDIALITSIGIDHAGWLGDTREKIAAEKAGIIKRNALAVCGDAKPPPAIARTAARENCRLLQSGADYQATPIDGGGKIHWQSEHAAVPDDWRDLRLPVPFAGAKQADNLGGVTAVLAATSTRTEVTPAHLAAGLTRARLAGRCQVLPARRGRPEVILDVAHNADAVRVLADFVRTRRAANAGARVHAVCGLLADKPAAEIFGLMRPLVARWYLAGIDGERGQSAAALRSALAADAAASLHESPVAAYRAAADSNLKKNILLIFGSFQVIGNIMGLLTPP